MRLHDDLAGAVHVPAQVVVEHGGQPARLEQFAVVPVQVVCDERPARAPPSVEGVEDGPVAAADGVHGLDVLVPVQGVEREPVDRRVEPVAVGDFGEMPVRPPFADRGPEADLALLLAAEDAAAQRDQDAAAPPRRPGDPEPGDPGESGDPGKSPSHWLTRYAAVAPADRLSIPT